MVAIDALLDLLPDRGSRKCPIWQEKEVVLIVAVGSEGLVIVA